MVAETNIEPYTYAYLECFLRAAVTIAPVVSLREAIKLERFIFLRHDIDLSVDYAFNIVQIEKKYSISSSLFFMTTSNYYNATAPKERAIIKNIHSCGFEIGLHFDPVIYPLASDEQMQVHLNREKELLESVIEAPVESVSLHNPSIHGKYLMFEKMNNAYASDLFSSERYLSDSCRNMRGKDMFSFLDVAKKRNVQILLHPMYWHTEHKPIPDIFCEQIYNLQEVIREHQSFIINRTEL